MVANGRVRVGGGESVVAIGWQVATLEEPEGGLGEGLGTERAMFEILPRLGVGWLRTKRYLRVERCQHFRYKSLQKWDKKSRLASVYRSKLNRR